MISFKSLGNLGRIGNQMFQISAAVSLAIDNNDKYAFPRWREEGNFPLYDCFYTTIDNKSVYKEKSFVYEEIQYRPDMDLFGYFQSWRYFENNKDVIAYLLTPNNGYSIKWGYTSIHVRRGDYLTLKGCYENLGMDYYNAAMKAIGSKRYMVFSDDIEWCKKNFVGEQFEFSEGDVIDDLRHMISCEHNIIANSSLSWWGAYLNKNPSKIVVAPKKWFGPKQPHNVKDLIPNAWMQI